MDFFSWRQKYIGHRRITQKEPLHVLHQTWMDRVKGNSNSVFRRENSWMMLKSPGWKALVYLFICLSVCLWVEVYRVGKAGKGTQNCMAKEREWPKWECTGGWIIDREMESLEERVYLGLESTIQRGIMGSGAFLVLDV